ncbi:MAG: hypothetical protein JNL08_16810 [Planctomycetes bacterium]|nr:hypothetical protein [Planctomycetota bacterium]
MSPLRRSVLALVLAVPVAAQDQATTLLANATRADVVVRARVVAATDPSPDFHRLEFAPLALLKGTVGATFSLLEPAGACCGRSLFALQPGDAVLLFLRRTGATLHPLGGARGVLADDPAVAAAVTDLLAAGDDAARAAKLTAQLGHADPRVAADAAQALAVLPQLALSASQRTVLLAELQDALQHRRTTLGPLVDAALRLGDDVAVDHLLPLYLAAPFADAATLLRRRLGRVAPDALLSGLSDRLDGDAGRQLRGAELLADLPAAQAGTALRSLLARTTCPRVQLCASRALLLGGARTTELAGVVPAPVLELAERRGREPAPFQSLPRTRP